ncbi:NAD(P)-dependent oxidoreductase [Chryseolinea sp. T2]|uniref:NAD(P)-dependent oxidoreductase n=1 Tax=Chryseolinea sp. T2 TaxID=3129255 RepID=UPI003077785A
MSSRVCLVIDPMHESLFSMLKEIGWTVDYQPDISRARIKEIASNYDGLIVRSKTFIDGELLGPSPTVRFIGRAGAGLDNLDLEYLHQHNIAVLHASEGNRDAVGEYTVGALLSLMRNIPRADAQVRQMQWEREANRGEEIMSKTVGIIGYGNMGRAFAQRLSGFGCNIIAYDKYKTTYSDTFCKESTMDQIWENADILSLHIPLTPETRGLITIDYLKRFRRPIILANTARGEIVEMRVVAEALQLGLLRGAVLDVLQNEKLDRLTAEQASSFEFLRKRSDVIFTPHIAGWTFESHVKINVALVNKIKVLSQS